VTGATNGIGKVTAIELAKMGAQVVIIGRNPAKVQDTLTEISAKSGGRAQATALVGDLSLMSEVRRLAAEFLQKYSRLDVLVNNAGGVFSQRQVTAEGLEMTFALNHMSYFLLTALLLDRLKASTPARIISVSSGAHTMGALNFDDLQNTQGYGMGGFRAYSQSKMMNILFTYALARRLKGTNVTANTLHPGAVATGFGLNSKGLFMRLFGLARPFMLSPEKGADTMIYLASSPEVEGVSGQYFDRRKSVQSAAYAYDEAAQERLWQVSEQIAEVKAAV